MGKGFPVPYIKRRGIERRNPRTGMDNDRVHGVYREQPQQKFGRTRRGKEYSL